MVCSSPRGRARSSARSGRARAARDLRRARAAARVDRSGAEEVSAQRARQDGVPRRAGGRARRLRVAAARHFPWTRPSCSSPSTSRSPATSARWRALPTPREWTRCSSPARTSIRGTRTRSVRRRAPCSRCRSSRRRQDDVAALPLRKIAAVVGAARAHTAADYTGPTAFLIGAEDAGLDDDWRDLADDGGRDPDERSGDGLAEREHRRRCPPLRSRAPARGCYVIT